MQGSSFHSKPFASYRTWLWALLAGQAIGSTAMAAEKSFPKTPLPIDLTLVDDKAIAFATFQSHNQKVVSNRNGIFLTYVKESNDDYSAQLWRLVRSRDGGKTFDTVREETRATSAPAVETDRDANLFLAHPDFKDGNAYLTRLSADGGEPTITKLAGGSAGKYCLALDGPRGQLYFLAHNGTFHVTGLDGEVRQTTRLLVSGKNANPQYPHLSVGADGVLYAACTTEDAGNYRSIQALKSPDGGKTWQALDGRALEMPIVIDETGPTTRISREDELDVHSWLSGFMAKDDKLHFAYWAKTTPQRQRYLRYDTATGAKEVDVEPLFAARELREPNDSGALVADRATANSPLYFVSTIDDRKRLACLVSYDNGATWQEYAVSDRKFDHRVYSIGAAREITADGDIIGTFTDVAYDGAKTYHEPNSGRVYFFRIKARRANPVSLKYRIETIAGNGREGDTPDESLDATQVPVHHPFGVEFGPNKQLYITAIGHHRVLRLDTDTGKLTSVAGSGKKGYAGDHGPATAAAMNEPYEVRFDSRRNMLILEMRNHLIRRVDANSGTITTLAGDGTAGFAGDGGPASEARFQYPHSLVLDARDNIFVVDILNQRVRRIDAESGIITTIAGNGDKAQPRDGGLAIEQPLIAPQGPAIHNGYLWLASFQGQVVWRINLASGVIERIAGTGERGYAGDGGNPLEATFDGPRGVKMTADGVFYVVEGENNVIRAIDTVHGQIWTVAGAGPTKHEYAGDGVPAVEAPLWQPHGVCVSDDGSLIISDTKNHRVRRLVPIKPESP